MDGWSTFGLQKSNNFRTKKWAACQEKSALVLFFSQLIQTQGHTQKQIAAVVNHTQQEAMLQKDAWCEAAAQAQVRLEGLEARLADALRERASLEERLRGQAAAWQEVLPL